MRQRLPPWLLQLLAGAVVLAAGLAAGRAWLPAGPITRLPPRAQIVAEFREAARRPGVELMPGEPRVRLRTPEDDNRVTRRLLGEQGEAWIARHGRGLELEVSQAAQWGPAPGELTVSFSASGERWSVEWTPATLPGFFSAKGQPQGLCGLLLGPGERPGSRRTSSGAQTEEILTAVVGSAEPTHLLLIDPPGSTVLCTRRPGTLAAAAADLDSHGFGAGWVRALPPLSLVLFSAILFLVLAFRARVDLSNAAVLAVTLLVTALAGDWPSTGPAALIQTVVAGSVAVWLLLLWSAAESWARSRLPDFTTTLDTLRRRRLGAHAGGELIAGWAAGAGLAGLRVGLLAAAAALPGVAPAEAVAPLPLFALGPHPLRRAMLWVGALLLACILGRKLSARWGTPLLLLAIPFLVTPLALAPWPATYGAGLLLSALLLLVLRRAGLTAALLAAVLAQLLPTAALAWQHSEWVPITAMVTLLFALGPLVAGLVGVARGEGLEHDPGAVPEFVRREERERRLSYEMDLLSRMQLGLLPQSLPRLPGYEVTARSLLATEAGGDLYDFLRDDRGRLWIAAGDVSGHGYSCAIGQASVKASLLSLVDGQATPAYVLDRTDRVVRGSSIGGRQFVTLCLVCLEEASGRLLVSNAGHPFPLIATANRQVREIEVPGLPLGQGPPRRYRNVEVELPRGGVLLLYSDGLYEANDPNGVPYGFDRPRRVLADAAAWNAAEVLERLMFDWRRHLAGSAPADDTTLVVLKRQ